MKEYERERWALQSWLDVFVALVQGQLQNLFLSISHQLLVATQLAVTAAPGSGGEAKGLGAAGSSAVTVDAAAPFAAISRRQSLPPPGVEAAAPPPLLLLLLCRLCQVLERDMLAQVLGRVQELYPDRLGSGYRREEPPAFLAGELGR